MTDPNVILPVGLAPPGGPVPILTPSTGFTTDQITALGGRAVQVAPAWDIDHLRAACSNLTLVKNTGRSTGASPVLKELLMQSGYTHAVTREIFDDGDMTEHKGGMAIDITSDDLPALSRVFQGIPQVFTQAYYVNDDYPDESLYVSDGVLVSPSIFSSVARSDQMHVSSTLNRLLNALTIPAVRSAFGTAALGLFTNRDVYAVLPTSNQATHEPNGVEFW